MNADVEELLRANRHGAWRDAVILCQDLVDIALEMGQDDVAMNILYALPTWETL